MSADSYREPLYDAPMPCQMRQLAMMGARSTKEGRSLKRNTRTDEFYAFDRIDAMTIGEPEGEIGMLRHTMGMRLGRQAIKHSWRLEYYDSYHVEQPPGHWMKATSIYRFSWDGEAVRQAHREVRVRDTLTIPPLDALLANPVVPDDVASRVMLGVQVDFERVDRGDCERLIEDVRAYYHQIESISR